MQADLRSCTYGRAPNAIACVIPVICMMYVIKNKASVGNKLKFVMKHSLFLICQYTQDLN